MWIDPRLEDIINEELRNNSGARARILARFALLKESVDSQRRQDGMLPPKPRDHIGRGQEPIVDQDENQDPRVRMPDTMIHHTALDTSIPRGPIQKRRKAR